MPSILILEDDEDLAEGISLSLKERLRSQFGFIGFGCAKPDRGCFLRFDPV